MTFSLKDNGQPRNLDVKIHNQACKHDNCDSHIIKNTDTYRYLGVTIDQHLRWDKHAQLTATRTQKTL